jgi:hypothetical protein
LRKKILFHQAYIINVCFIRDYFIVQNLSEIKKALSEQRVTDLIQAYPQNYPQILWIELDVVLDIRKHENTRKKLAHHLAGCGRKKRQYHRPNTVAASASGSVINQHV